MSNSIPKSASRRWLGIATMLAALPTHPQVLPQGLTCGLSYFFFGNWQENNACNGVLTSDSGSYTCFDPSDSTCNLCNCVGPCGTVPGFSWCRSTNQGPIIYQHVVDGDWGDTIPGEGYRHLELLTGVNDPTLATSFVLPEGAACGFHHTRNTPGRTCMGYDAAKYFGLQQDGPAPGIPGCPPGWLPRKAFDQSSNYGYWTWCEYQDPDHHSWGQPVVQPLGVACGTAHNDSGQGTFGECMGYSTLAPGRPACPAGMAGDSLGWVDNGEPSTIGLGFCTLMSNPLPANAHELFYPMCTCRSCPPHQICDDGVQCPTPAACGCPCYNPDW